MLRYLCKNLWLGFRNHSDFVAHTGIPVELLTRRGARGSTYSYRASTTGSRSLVACAHIRTPRVLPLFRPSKRPISPETKWNGRFAFGVAIGSGKLGRGGRRKTWQPSKSCCRCSMQPKGERKAVQPESTPEAPSWLAVVESRRRLDWTPSKVKTTTWFKSCIVYMYACMYVCMSMYVQYNTYICMYTCTYVHTSTIQVARNSGAAVQDAPFLIPPQVPPHFF